MWQPRITLNGMFLYDPTLFDGIVLPDGMSKELMIDQIIRQSGDLFPLYQVPEQVKKSITQWFERRLPNFEKLWRGFTAEYNPIENYDRHEESTETPDITRTSTSTGNKSETPNISRTSTSNADKTETPNITRSVSNSGEDSSTNTANVAGFDSSGYVPNSQTTASGTSSTSGTETESGTRKTSDNSSVTEKESGTREYAENGSTTDKESGTRTTVSRVHGNIGVTTSAQMLEGELALRASLDLYVVIATEFEADNLLQVY